MACAPTNLAYAGTPLSAARVDLYVREGKFQAAARFSLLCARPLSRVMESFADGDSDDEDDANAAAAAKSRVAGDDDGGGGGAPDDPRMRGLLAFCDTVLFRAEHLDRVDETATLADRLLHVRAVPAHSSVNTFPWSSLTCGGAGTAVSCMHVTRPPALVLSYSIRASARTTKSWPSGCSRASRCTHRVCFAFSLVGGCRLTDR
jgi:hypothetical protein